jgi:hypothetical protein
MEVLAMFKMRRLARLVILVLAATKWQTLAAEEPVGSTRPATSIHEWKSNPTATAAADATSPAKSIHEWNPKPITAPAANAAVAPTAVPAAVPAAIPPATPAVSAAVPQSPITISFTSTLRQGNLVVMLDDVPIFNEKFQKPVLLISQTTTWDPLQVAAGEHRLSAKVYGTKKTYFSSLYDLHVSGTKGSALRFVMQGDRLTVELAS